MVILWVNLRDKKKEIPVLTGKFIQMHVNTGALMFIINNTMFCIIHWLKNKFTCMMLDWSDHLTWTTVSLSWLLTHYGMGLSLSAYHHHCLLMYSAIIIVYWCTHQRILCLIFRLPAGPVLSPPLSESFFLAGSMAKHFHNLRVSSAAAETTVDPSGLMAMCRIRDVWPVQKINHVRGN